MNKQCAEHYCSGCGLCNSEYNVSLIQKENGFKFADIKDENVDFLKAVCPSASNTLDYLYNSIWGPIKEVYGGWSTDDNIRYRASSGGVLTAVALYLLDKNLVDAVIQTGVDKNNPLQTVTVCSTTRGEVLDCIGSRYCESAPLMNLTNIVENTKKYAFIGRPCDVLALRKYMDITQKYKENILYLFSFFCAGTPSEHANKKMLMEMQCIPEKCISLSYRGNGWPGYATAVDSDGNEHKMKYAESWANYLGRDIRPICRFCADGTGAAADLSCGDYWQIEEGRPDFGEHEGRNMIFARTEKGIRLLQDMKLNGFIEIIPFAEGKENIHLVQPAQFERITTLFDKMLILKLFRRDLPAYSMKKLYDFGKKNSFRNHLRIFKGTIKRVIKKHM